MRQIDGSRKLRLVPWFISGAAPAGSNARTKARGRHPNTQPRIMTPHSAAYSVTSHTEPAIGALTTTAADSSSWYTSRRGYVSFSPHSELYRPPLRARNVSICESAGACTPVDQDFRVEVKGLEPSASTLRNQTTQCCDQDKCELSCLDRDID